MLGNAGALGTGLLAVGANATLDSSVALNLANAIDLDAGAQLSLTSNQNTALGGLITGTGGLIKTGTGVLSLNNSNLFSGGLALNAGGLSVGA
ncbi:hypothetical protein G4229_14640, partial [Listeria seeligeri]|nr:hypothetical protein [Listeria seeligeri]